MGRTRRKHGHAAARRRHIGRQALGTLAVVLALLALLASTGLASATTLDTIRARGKLVCGSTDPLPGFAQQNKDGR
ncbi:MAG: hypothetical protein ABI377_10720, partial [Devosia sp.]